MIACHWTPLIRTQRSRRSPGARPLGRAGERVLGGHHMTSTQNWPAAVQPSFGYL
ncbi:unnamed protein product, partial [Staurois parvus]